MIPVPNRRTVIIATIPLFLIIGGFIVPSLINSAIIFNLILLGFAIFDIIYSIKTIDVEINIQKSKIFSIGRINNFDINVKNKSKKFEIIRIRLELSMSMEDLTDLKKFVLEPMARKKISLEIRPSRRGNFKIKTIFYKIKTRLKIFDLYYKEKTDVNIEVLPDIKKLNHFLKLLRIDRASAVGIHKNRYKGLGTELESLRDYQIDDDSRYIDWKATTRLNKPITKVFQAETHNHIIIAMDCGRLMTAEQNGINTLDHAVNSLLMLSHIAFRVQDTISIIAYSDRIIDELPEVKSKSAMNKVNKFITKLKPEYVESNYNLIFNYLQKRAQKRSLIIFLTDLIDDINYETFKKGINHLSRKNLVLFILLRDTLLTENANKDIESIDDVFHRAAAQEMFTRRHRAIAKLKKRKIQVLDVLPHELSSNLINKYLELKSKNRL